MIFALYLLLKSFFILKFKRIFGVFCTFVVVQFSMSDLFACRSVRQLCYYTTLFEVCQGVLQKFFKFFSTFFFRSPHRLPVNLFGMPSSEGLCIILLSSPFVKGFSKSFSNYFFACVTYHPLHIANCKFLIAHC